MSSDERKWFIYSNTKTTGPVSTADVQSLTANNPTALIWGRGLQEWFGYDRWLKYTQDQAQAQKNPQTPQRQWKVMVKGDEKKPMAYDQMMDFLKTVTDLAGVKIWTEGYSDWKEIFQIHKIMDELGVSRRQHPRVPIMGSLVCEGTNGNFEARVLSISEGGLGITETPTIKIGERFKVHLKSPNLFTPVNATAEVVYVGSDNYAGLKFISLASEAKNSIIEYVIKFQELRSQTNTNITVNQFNE